MSLPSSVHEMLTALADVLEAGPGSGDLDWILQSAMGLDTIGSTDGLSPEEKRLYTAVRGLVIEAEWRGT